jgi:carbon-monoxide dehydrogenase small subunit
VLTRFTVNDRDVSVDTPPMARLLDVLREEVRLTGAKEGCGEGECGACTVLIDGLAVNSCLVPVCQVEGARLTTVEGLAADDRLHPVQEAFLRCGAAQCGICTPGFLVAAKELLDRTPHPTRAQAREALAGNLCRCTGYQKIVDAVTEALATEAR